MASFDAADLTRRLDALEFPRAVAFTAACAQRRRTVGVRILEAHARSEDAAAYDLALEQLWSTAQTRAGVAPEAATAAWDRFDELPEFEAEEESSGELAYSEDAITTLWYATQYARGEDAANAVHCASRSFDAAGFLDRQSTAAAATADRQDSDLADAEVRIQLEDLADLAGGEPLAALVARIRARAEAEGERVAAAVPHPGATA
jgi:hypothetical protein